MVDIGLINASVSADKAELVAYHQNLGFVAHYFAGFVKYQLDHARVFLRGSGKFYGALARFNRIQRYQTAFGLGDDFLCNADHVAVLQCCRILFKRTCDPGDEIITVLDHADAGQPDNLESRRCAVGAAHAPCSPGLWQISVPGR